MFFLLVIYALRLCPMATFATAQDTQTSFNASDNWTVVVSTTWDVLGPFPIQAREQQYLSPSFPLNLSEPINYLQSWPSSYADGGSVSWTTVRATDKGELKISFPDVRWESLRATEGWAALQHHAVLRATLTVYPPRQAGTHDIPHLLVQLVQGSYFAIRPTSNASDHLPHWYAGNIYAMERALPQVVALPVTPSFESPTHYDIFVSGDYEIRLFGDPHTKNSQVPVQSININVEIEGLSVPFVREPSQDVICDIVGGLAFGNAIGLGIRSILGSWTVTRTISHSKSLSLDLVRATHIVDGQTRIVPIRIAQMEPFVDETIELEIFLTSDVASPARTKAILVTLPVKHIPAWSEDSYSPILASYFYSKITPTQFAAVPPHFKNGGAVRPPILALHGAGVDIVESTFWADSLLRNDNSWIILPSGRTSWGLDWHGPSAKDAWASVDALSRILNNSATWESWGYPENTPVVLMGHSNGGQGAWYSASRYPDKVIGVVPAAGYIKSQSYVPLTMSRSAHFVDPMLMAILESSLTPDNNDQFIGNLVDTPILAVHGGDDENVPVWHSREAVSLLKTWNPSANVTFLEEPGEGHWYPSVLNNDKVNDFVRELLDSYPPRQPIVAKLFTLTVSIPWESGSLHGWKVQALTTPGRLGRLTVERGQNGHVKVTTTNLDKISVDTNHFTVTTLTIDRTPIHLKEDEDGVVYFEAVNPKIWKIVSEATENSVQASGRMQAVLSGTGSLTLVVSDEANAHEMSVALRFAHDLALYHRLDAEVITSSEAVLPGALGPGNVVVIGNDASLALASDRVRQLIEPDEPLNGPGIGLLFLHSHPSNPQGNMAMMRSTDDAGLERVARLLPIRTGIPVPDWIIVGPLADTRGAGGVLSAGVWGNDWSWNGPMSWAT